MSSKQRRVVITGIGLVSPLGNSKETLWEALCQGRSGVGPLTVLTPGAVPLQVAAEARQFTGEIEDFGPLEKEQKKQIRKGLRVMCRECQMGVAVAQLALTDAAILAGAIDPDRIGVSYGTDYMLSLPEEFNEGIRQCLSGEGTFEFPRWGLEGLPKMSPLWLLKYLPNMPASHVAIFNDLRGPSNSLTLREAGANLAVGEAYQIILRGHADVMVCGATGTRLHAMKIVHAVTQEEVACGNGDPTKVSRPFDRQRSGMVLGARPIVRLACPTVQQARRRVARAPELDKLETGDLLDVMRVQIVGVALAGFAAGVFGDVRGARRYDVDALGVRLVADRQRVAQCHVVANGLRLGARERG